MEKLNRRDFLRLTALAAAGTALGACAPQRGKGGGGGTFIVGRGGDSVNLDLASVTDGESWRVGGVILDTLVKLDGIPVKPVPWLAESWESPDGKTWTFKIREGARFHDGTLPIVDCLNFFRAYINANHFVALRCQTGCCHRTNIAQPEDTDVHYPIPSSDIDAL